MNLDVRLRRLGERVKAARTMAGQTQAEVAASAGIHRVHLAKIEAGGENVTVGTLYGLADHFHVPISHFMAD